MCFSSFVYNSGRRCMFREVFMACIIWESLRASHGMRSLRALHCMLSWRDLRVLSTRLADKSENSWLWVAHKHFKINNTQTMYDVMEMRSTRILAHACFSIGRPRHHGLQVVLCSQPWQICQKHPPQQEHPDSRGIQQIDDSKTSSQDQTRRRYIFINTDILQAFDRQWQKTMPPTKGQYAA